MNKLITVDKSQIPNSKFQIPRGLTSRLGAWNLRLGNWVLKSNVLTYALILPLLLLSCPVLHAQNPGYQGKRLSLNYGLHTFNAISNPNEFGNSGVFSFNTLQHGNLDIAVGRRITLGASFEYIHNSFSFDKSFTYYRDNSDTYYDNNSFTFRSHSIGKMEVYGIGLYMRRFFGGNIAPLGTYIKPELTLLFYKVYPGHPGNHSGLPGDPEPEFRNYSPYKTVAISLELGQNRILFNRMFIDYGVRLGIVPGMITMISGDSPAEKNYLQNIPLQRLAGQYLFNIKLGVGVLLF